MPDPLKAKTALDLDELTQLANAATPGKRSTFCRGVKKPPTGLVLHMSALGQGVQSDHEGRSFPAADDNYHAALDPATVLALVARARWADELQKQLDEVTTHLGDAMRDGGTA
jgi:hypothetical protein